MHHETRKYLVLGNYMSQYVITITGEFALIYKGVWKSGGRQVPVAMKTLKVSSFTLHV